MTKDIISKKNQHRWIFVVLLIVATSSSLAFAEDSASSNSDIGSIAGVLWPVFLGWIGAIVLSFRKHKLSVLLSSLCGILLSAYLSWQHISGNDAAACQVGELFNCAKVNTSIYGVLSGHLSFLPSVPLAFLGFSFYASIFFLGITTLSDDENQIFRRLIEKSMKFADLLNVYWLCPNK